MRRWDEAANATALSQVLKELLDCGAPVNLTCESGWTPLHRACISGHLSIAQELVVSRKANILAATKDGRTPILLAAQGKAFSAGAPVDILLYHCIGILLQHHQEQCHNEYMPLCLC